MKRRIREHKREFMKGNYTVLDTIAANLGERKELWHGWQYASQNRKQFFENQVEIQNFVEKELIAYRIFVTECDDVRKRERMEAALLMIAYLSKKYWTDLIDGGMTFRSRYNSEMPVKVNNVCNNKIYGLPETIEI